MVLTASDMNEIIQGEIIVRGFPKSFVEIKERITLLI